MRIVRTRRGARIVEGGAVLSEILAVPGPTHSVFDLLAACVAALAPGPRVALLGFAGGGMIAPLRAMRCHLAIDAVDLSLAGASLFRRFCSRWAGTVRLARDDAARWLRRPRAPFDVIVEDLTIPRPTGTTKPALSLDEMPALVRSRLATRGILVANLLPVPGVGWADAIARVAAPYSRSVVAHLDGFENRVVVAGEALEPPRALARRIRAALDGIGSRVAVRLRGT